MEELRKQAAATVVVKFGTETYHTPIQEPEKRISVRDIAERFKLEEESIEVRLEEGSVAFQRDKETGLSVVRGFEAGTELVINGKPGKFCFYGANTRCILLLNSLIFSS